jgi:hypothetical protein
MVLLTLNHTFRLDAYHVHAMPAVLQAQARCHRLTFQ